MSGVSEQVAWKLIKQDNEGKRTLRRVHPVGEFVAGRAKMQVLEGLANAGVECSCLGEPLPAAILMPEVDNGLR